MSIEREGVANVIGGILKPHRDNNPATRLS